MTIEFFPALATLTLTVLCAFLLGACYGEARGYCQGYREAAGEIGEDEVHG